MTTTPDDLAIIDGIAALIVANVPGTAYNPDAVYTSGQVGIFNMLLPESPDECIVLTWVPQVDHPSMPLGSGVLQIRVRGAKGQPRRPIELLGPIANLLIGATQLPITTDLTIIQVHGRVRAPHGMDESKRWGWSDNYTLDVSYTPTALRPAGGAW